MLTLKQMPAGNLPASTLKFNNSIIQCQAVFPSSQSCVSGHGQSWPQLFANSHVKTRPFARCHLTAFIWTFWMTLTDIYFGQKWQHFGGGRESEKGNAFSAIFRWTWFVTSGRQEGCKKGGYAKNVGGGSKVQSGPGPAGRKEETGAKADEA